jgi:hypothetical protein
MKQIRLALSVIGAAYALLGIVVGLFALFSATLGRRADIGTVYGSVVLLGWGATLAMTGMLAGSVLGTLSLVMHHETRRPLYLLAILSGWIGALVLGWMAWGFWTH